jgi:hypothetical protein
MPVNRRRFLKYAGATAAVVGSSALGLEYLASRPAIPGQQTLTTLNQTTTTSTVPMPPKITSLTYEPTRAVNSKIYDIRVDIGISNPSRQLSSVQVMLEPVVYIHLPTEAFPNEQPKTTTLQTTDLESEVLSTLFTNLKGGREYDLKTILANESSTMDERTLRTEYVREFENTSRLDDVTVIADYYTWYEPGGWTNAQGKKVYADAPLLGEYNSGDSIVIDKQTDWTTGFGVDAFAVSWWGPNSRLTSKFENRFLKSPMLSQIKFCILYENNGRLIIQNQTAPPEKWIEDLDNPYNSERLVSDFEYLTRYFSSPQYLKIDGRPCVRFDYTTPFRGDIKGVLDEVRTKLRAMGWGVYLINDLAGRSIYPSDLISANASDWRYPNISPAHALQVIENTDAIGGSCPLTAPSRMNFDGAYKMWRDFSMKHGKDSIPVAWPGSVDSPRSPKYFRDLLEPSIRYSTKATIEITSFNEWIVGTQIEPAKQYGFDYLRTLKDVVSKA